MKEAVKKLMKELMHHQKRSPSSQKQQKQAN